MNGFYLGTAFIIWGGVLSLYTGYLISFCAEKTGGSSYEEIGLKIYGNAGMRITSFCNLLCNMGFLISYIVLFKQMMPYTLESMGIDLPEMFADTKKGSYTWATIFSFCLMFPISLPRSLSALRYSSFLSFGISLFLVGTVFSMCFKDGASDSTPTNEKYDFGKRFEKTLHADNITVGGIFNSIPLVIFSFMYQPNIPAIHQELKKRSVMNMQKVLLIGTTLATVAYIMTGEFGYATFSLNENVDVIMEKQNILKGDYDGSNYIKACLIGVLIVVLFASPFCVLPCKDSIE